MEMFYPVALLATLVLLSSCSVHDAKTSPPAAAVPEPVAETIEPAAPYCRVDYNYPLEAVCSPRIYVYKSKRRLMLVENDILIRDYRIALGPRPSGDKLIQGDGRTPEGEFFICVKNPASNYYKSLGLSYPDTRHADRALLSGIITYTEYQRIVEALQNNHRPPWNTPLGGEIFIHGGGAHTDWTKGCIALFNSDMEELFNLISVGARVQILP
jgi:hypothetical protein